MSPNEGDRTMIPMLRAEYRRVNHPVRISSPRHWIRSKTKFTTLTASSSVQLARARSPKWPRGSRIWLVPIRTFTWGAFVSPAFTLES